MRQVVETAEAERAGAIVYAIDIPPKFELLADPDHIPRVIENLCRNAAQVLVSRGAQNGRPTAIRLAAIRTDGVALIEISDTGPGFPPEQTARIFEPFHLTTREGGTGPRPRHRRRSRRAQRRLDQPRRGARATISIAARGSSSPCRRPDAAGRRGRTRSPPPA